MAGLAPIRLEQNTLAMPPSLATCTGIVALPTCRFGVFEQAGALAELRFLEPSTPLRPPESNLAEIIAAQVERYLADPYTPLESPRALRGTPFQHAVWLAISAIPAGRTRRYADLAKDLNSSARAVGQACGANPLPLLVPCHRVMGGTGLTGFAHSRTGWLIETKQWLLVHEGVSLL